MKHRPLLAAALSAYLICIGPSMATAAESSASQISIEELRTRLALTPEQQEKIAPYVEERRAKMEPVRAKLSAAASRREKMAVFQEAKAIQDDFSAKVQPILTKEQQAEWQKIREELREQMKERHRNR